MPTRKQLDEWLEATEWVAGDVSVSGDAMRSAAVEPDPDEPVRFGGFVGTVIGEGGDEPPVDIGWIP